MRDGPADSMRRRGAGSRRVVALAGALVAASTALTAAGCGDPTDMAVVYSSLEPEVLEWAEGAFRSAHPGMRVRFEFLSPDSALRRVRGERESPEADLWWGAPSWKLAEAAEEGLLMETAPAWAAMVPGTMKDGEGRWVGMALDPVVIAFNTDSVTRARAPWDWLDLPHPRWSGEILLPEPGLSDALTALLVQRMWSAREAYGDPAQGLDFLARLDASRAGYERDGGSAARRLRRGDALLAVLPLTSAESERRRGGIEYRVPGSGTPAVIVGIARLAGSPHPDAAAAFLEWVGSPAAAAGWSAVVARVPTSGFPEPFAGVAAPEWSPRVLPGLVPELVPADSVAPRVDEWVGRWRSEVRAREEAIR